MRRLALTGLALTVTGAVINWIEVYLIYVRGTPLPDLTLIGSGLVLVGMGLVFYTMTRNPD